MSDPVAEVTEATVKLVLDEVTGEQVTRNEPLLDKVDVRRVTFNEITHWFI